MKILAFVFGLCLVASTVLASPFIICDPQTNVDEYVVVIDGSAEIVSAQDLGDGTVRLHYDLGDIAEGAHQVEIRAKNIWGVSSPVPFEFEKSLPATVTGVELCSD